MPPITPMAMPAFAPVERDDESEVEEEGLWPLELPPEEPVLEEPPFPELAPLDDCGEPGVFATVATSIGATQLLAVSMAMIFAGADLSVACEMVNWVLSRFTVRTAEEKNMPPMRGIMPSPGAIRTIGICLDVERVSMEPEVEMKRSSKMSWLFGIVMVMASLMPTTMLLLYVLRDVSVH